MNPRAEMCKLMHDYGQPLKLYCGTQFVNGSGIFDKIYNDSPEKERKSPSKLGYDDNKNYSLWAYDFTRIEKVDRVACEGKSYSVLSGEYDSQIGCFRLTVKEEN